jgi:hypothetical protein
MGPWYVIIHRISARALTHRTGVPIAWMLSSNGTTATISFFLNWVKTASPAVRPSIIMTDRDLAQMKALEVVYPDSRVFLCIWHVLRALRSHFVPEEFHELWTKVKSMVKTEDSNEFKRIWAEITKDPSVPKSFVDYLKTDWEPKSDMWALSNRTDRTLLEEGDTNMLIEALVIVFVINVSFADFISRYHHVLKTHWLDGKRNRRIDHIIATLVDGMVPYYEARHERQSVGVEGADLVERRRREILASAESISRDSIQQFDDSQFHVASASRPGDFYAIDLARQSCNCKDFHRIKFCKHLAAVKAYFPHLCLEGNTEVTVPAQAQRENLNPVPEHSRPAEDLGTLTREITVLSQTLASCPVAQSSSSPAVVEAFRAAKYSLTAAVASTQGTSALPDKEKIPPNQGTWPDTAEHMGVRPARARKQPQPAKPAKERGITERSIGAAKGKKRKIYEDPYAGGERSGKRAKPDALSAAANDRARALRAGVSAPAFQHSPAPIFGAPVLAATQPMPQSGAVSYTFPPLPARFPPFSQ